MRINTHCKFIITPFDCDLSLHNLLYNQEKHKQFVVVFRDAKCSRPETMTGQLVRNLKRKDLTCNTINYFSSCKCFYDELDESVHVNCSDQSLQTFPDLREDKITRIGINEIQFDYSNNLLKNLPEIPFDYEFNVTKLIAPNNSIVILNVNNMRDNLKVLDVRNNSLKYLNEDVMKKLSKMEKVWLGGNHWQCDCSTVEYFQSLKNVICDYDDIYCANINKKLKDSTKFELCFNWPLVAGCGVSLGLLGIFTTLFYKFKKDIKIFLYAHDMCLWFVSEEELDEDKQYDAFVCFAEPDQLIVEEIVTKLESEPDCLRCLVGVRDWPLGEMFPELVRNNKFSVIKL